MGRKYPLIEGGEWVQPEPKGYKMACCDCGGVHLMRFRVKNGIAQFQCYRDGRATGQIRRRKILNGEGIFNQLILRKKKR